MPSGNIRIFVVIWVDQSFANGLAEVPAGRDSAVEWSTECYPGPDREYVHA
ncbi:hypothetical protein [Longispora urticae]